MSSRGERAPLLVHRNSSVHDLERQQQQQPDPSSSIPNVIQTRNRNNSIASIASVVTTLKDFVIENYPSKSTLKFIASIVFAIFAFLVFNLIFLPRTSLGRDYRSVHFSPLSKVETERLFLRHISEENKIKEYLDGYKTTGSADFTFNKLNEFGLKPYMKKYRYHKDDEREQSNELINIIYEIPGLLDDTILIGNHRCSSNPSDPTDDYSGSAILLEISKAFGELIKVGWRPLRTIRVVSWDGEDNGVPASISYGEEYKKQLPGNVFAYLSLANHVTGEYFKADSNPLLNHVLLEVAKLIPYKDQEETLFDHWRSQNDKNINLIGGGGSDFTMFQNHLGIPSCEVSFLNNNISKRFEVPFYDQNYEIHNTMAKYFGFLGLFLSEHEVPEYKVSNYAKAISKMMSQYVEDIPADWLSDKWFYESIKELRDVIDDFILASSNFDLIASGLQDQISIDYPWFQFYKKINLAMKIKQIGSRVKDIDGTFIYDKGLSSRPWFKHILLAPLMGNGNGCDFLPGLHEALRDNNRAKFLDWVELLTERVNKAIGKLDV